MSLKTHGVRIDCARCKCASGGDKGTFDVTVPLQDDDNGISGSARLRCTVTPERHEVALTEWRDAEHRPVPLSEDLQKRVNAALDLVAEHRVCGNRNLCPADVIRIVEENCSPRKTGR